MKILVVDDEPDIRELLSLILEARGFETEMAENGEEAARKVCDHPERYAVVLSDIKMPNMDGPTMATQIRANGIRTPIIFMTGLDSPSRSDCQGAAAVLNKPLNFEHLFELLQRKLA
ncbi:MAG: response regulator [Bdellovibrionales bacterium]